MSYNQSRSDKSDTTQYRKSDRRSASSNQQRGSSGAYVKGGGPAPSPSYVLSSGRSLKRNNNNAQGGQSRASVPTVNSSSLESSNVSTPRSAAVQNGSHVQPQIHGASDMPVTSPAAKPAELPAPQRSRTVPKVPTSQPASMSSDSTAPRTPIKAPGDASKAFSFQFGSISPGFMNGMQVPARTSSAPPNLDEQKRDQARHDSFRSAAPLPTPSAPKQQLPRKDAGAVNQPDTSVTDLPNLEHSRDLHTIISSAPSTTIPVTVKPSAGSIGEKVADSMRPNSSHGAEKGESPKHVRPSGEASSSHPERDSDICSESSLQLSKHDTEPLASKSLTPVATNQSTVPAVISSDQGLVSNPLSSALVSPLQTPSAPKQQLLRKDAGAVNQPNTGEAYPVPKAKKDTQVSPAPPTSQQQKPPGLPMTRMYMPKPFQQSQVSVQYGGPDQQLQSQGMTAAASLQIPLHMPLAMGNPPQVQPPVFVQGLQPHPMQTQGIIHQSQGLSFTTQMGPQLPPQLSSMGITMYPQYSQQQGGKFGVPRKTTVKITHPETHEDLRLDKRADSYSDGGSSGVRGRKKNIKKYLKKKGEGCTLGLSLNDEKFSIEQCEDVASSSVRMCGSSVSRKTTVKITHPNTHEELRLDKRADSYLDGESSGVRGRRKKNRKKYLKKKGQGCALGLSLNDEKFSIEQCEDVGSSSVKMCESELK